MKKIRLAFIALALLAGIGGAIASKPENTCEAYPQYYWTGSQYVPVPGTYGVSWYCEYSPASTCTYYRPTAMHPFQGCMPGLFRQIF